MKISKKLLSVFVALIMLLSVATVAIPAGAANEPTISIGEVDCFQNGDVVVPI